MKKRTDRLGCCWGRGHLNSPNFLGRSRRDLHGRSLAPPENDVEAIAERMAGYGGFPIEKRYQAVSRVLVRTLLKTGSNGSRGSSGKYICVTRRDSSPAPK